VLATTKPGAKLIAERFIAKKLPRDFFLQVSEALKKFGDDPIIAKLQAEVLRGGLLLSLEPGQVEKMRKQVAEKGDPKKGRELYLNTKILACATCHRLEGVGGSVGPDLTRIWDTMTVEKLLESIIEPSKEIKEGFQTYKLTTTGEQVIQGLKIKEDSKEVVIRDSNGRDTRVAREDIESLTPSKLSLMPDNVVSQISYDQFIDLLAFLKSQKEQESLRGSITEAGVAGPFPGEMQAATPEVKPDAKWKLVYAEPNGKLDFTSMLTSPNTAVYARVYIFAAKKQSITGTINTTSGIRAWLNDASVLGPKPTITNGPAVDSTFKADLKQGWNVLLLKVTNAGKSSTLSMRLAGDGLRTASSPVDLPGASGGQ
jgi:putative heme-binding domain-containing protein